MRIHQRFSQREQAVHGIPLSARALNRLRQMRLRSITPQQEDRADAKGERGGNPPQTRASRQERPEVAPYSAPSATKPTNSPGFPTAVGHASAAAAASQMMAVIPARLVSEEAMP